MLHLLDESLEAFLRAVVPLPEREVDVAFDRPDEEWAARVSRPTISLYLWSVRRNVSTAYRDVDDVENWDGGEPRDADSFRVDCRYLVTAWASDVRDEHFLLGAALKAILRHTKLPRQYLQGPYRDVARVPFIEVAADDGRNDTDFWSALGGRLKPGLDITVTAVVDVATDEAAPADHAGAKSGR